MNAIQFKYSAGDYEDFSREFAILLTPVMVQLRFRWILALEGLPVELLSESVFMSSDACMFAQEYCEEITGLADDGVNARDEMNRELAKILINRHNIFEYEQRELCAKWMEQQEAVAA